MAATVKVQVVITLRPKVSAASSLINEQSTVTGHTLPGLGNVEVGRQQLYTANLTDTYRGGSSVSSRVCPQGC
jgi:hypothetical protein